MNRKHPANYDRPRRGGWTDLARRLHRDESGATSTEYILILALVVLPIALMYPLFVKMIKTYAGRMTSVVSTPFP